LKKKKKLEISVKILNTFNSTIANEKSRNDEDTKGVIKTHISVHKTLHIQLKFEQY